MADHSKSEHHRPSEIRTCSVFEPSLYIFCFFVKTWESACHHCLPGMSGDPLTLMKLLTRLKVPGTPPSWAWCKLEKTVFRANFVNAFSYKKTSLAWRVFISNKWNLFIVFRANFVSTFYNKTLVCMMHFISNNWNLCTVGVWIQ